MNLGNHKTKPVNRRCLGSTEYPCYPTQPKITSPVMRYHGGKFRLAKWIQSFFPPHRTYVEPFGGAAGVLLQKKPSESEVYNDLDGDISNVFFVLQDKESCLELERLLMVTPYSRREFEKSYKETLDPVERARRTLIRAHMGFGSAGATKRQTGFRIDSARKYGTAAHLWASYPEKISNFCRRLECVLIENRTALEIFEGHDRVDTLFYVDPPYRHDTRVMGGHGRYYQYEMTDSDHEQLLNALLELEGFVVLSGYDSDQYNDLLSSWKKYSVTARISAGRGTGTRTECVWLNPRCQKNQAQMELFG